VEERTLFELEYTAYTAMVEHAYREAPNEACGLLIEGGRPQDIMECDRCWMLRDRNVVARPRNGWHWVSCGGHPLWYKPCRNVSGNPEHEFQLDPLEQLDAWEHYGRLWREDQWGGVRGIFHSHPSSTGDLSDMDVETLAVAAMLWGDGETSSLMKPVFPVLGMVSGLPDLRGWTLVERLAVDDPFRLV
jgi:proteasome lid subunit RPN8/RPN11